MSSMKLTVAWILREFYIFLGFSWRDLSATIVPASIFTVGAMRSSNLSFPLLVSSYTLLFSWLISYVYFFNISNQITGLEEDRVNKPDRPIPSGMVTMEGAKLRWILALAAFLGVAVYEPILFPETICWVITAGFLSLTSAGNHWLGKNCIALTIGTWSLLNGSWKIFAPVTMKSESQVLAVAVWAGLLTHIADLRDIKGDAAVGRKTLPLAFGDITSRWILTFLLMPTALYALWLGDVIAAAPTTIMALHVFLGYRLMHHGNPRYDHKTYMIYTYIFCFILATIAAHGSNVKIPGGLWGYVERSIKSTSLV